MHPIRVFTLLATAGLAAGNQEPAANVNSRYTVESVEIAPEGKYRVSDSLAGAMRALIGSKFNHESVEKLARRIRRELRARVVAMKVAKGNQPEHVRVIYEPSFRKGNSEVVLPRFVYHARQNFTFGADANFRPEEGHTLRFGILTDNDELIERYSGIRGGYERSGLAGDRLAVCFDIESWRAQWNGATRATLDRTPEVPGIYRWRFHFRPAMTVTPVDGLTLSGGISVQRFETQFPTTRTESSTAAIGSIRFERQWEPSPLHRHGFEAGYWVRSATRALESDFVYTRHLFDARYRYSGRRDELILSAVGGTIYGRAPLFERFALGNSRTLRGWNKIDVNPMGGDRMAHGSIDYRFHWFRAVYDVGSAWNRGQTARVRQSIAPGIGKDGMWLLVAFPIREGRADPIFMTGINF